MRPADWGRTGAFAAQGAIGEVGKRHYEQELKEAREAFKADPRPANANRVLLAETMLAMTTAAKGMGMTGTLAYPSVSGVTRYRPNRPNVGAAQTEVLSLNQLLRNRPIDPAEVTRRRQNPDFRVAPGTPLQPGEVERMVSPAGKKMLIRQPNGGWADEQGRPGTPRANWRRISAVEDPPSIG